MKSHNAVSLSTVTMAVLATFAASSAVSSAFAQTVEASTDDAIKVTASRVEQELIDVNMSVSVITEEQIRHSGARTVGELLANLPGVQISNDGSQGMKRVSIRGQNAFRTLVMIDGQKVAEHKSMSGAPMLIDPSMIERIEVIKGPASVLYGSDAIGGAINIITKGGGQKPLQGEVSTGLNTSSSGKSAAATIFGKNNGWNYRISAALEDNENLKTPVGYMPNTYFTSRNVSGFLSYDVAPNAVVGGAIDYYDLEFGSGNFGDSVFKVDVPEWKRTKSSLFAEFNDINESFRRVRLDTFYQQSSKKMINNVGGVWSQQDVNAFIAAGFKQPMLNAMGVIAGNNFLLQPNAKNDLDQYGLSSQFDLQLGKNHYLIAGYELSYDDLNAHSWNQGVNIMPMMKTNKKYSGYQLTNAIFASMESSLTSELTLNYGARYTWVKTHMNIVNNNTNAQSSSDGTDSKAVFNLGLLWHGLDNLILRGNFSQGYRSPILQELYIDTSMGSTSTTYANPSLKPEKSNNYELGARWAGQRFNADLAVFYNDTDDYITAVWKSALRASQYTNIANAKSYGAELTLSYKIGATGFEPYSSLSWIRRKTDDGQGFITYDSGVPNLMAKYGIRWSGEKAGLGLRADAYAVSHTKTKYKESTGSNNYVLGGYTTLNLTGGVSFGPQQQYSLDAGFYNIFNQAYREETAIYEPGRYLGVKLNARF